MKTKKVSIKGWDSSFVKDLSDLGINAEEELGRILREELGARHVMVCKNCYKKFDLDLFKEDKEKCCKDSDVIWVSEKDYRDKRIDDILE